MLLSGNIINQGRYHSYFIGGNICNSFVLGEPGSMDDFFLVGSIPTGDTPNYPVLTGNFLDSEGQVLFRLVKNMLVINPGNCSKILADHIGYEIHDSAGARIFKVETKYEKLPQQNSETFITTIEAQFYNRNKQLIFETRSGPNGSSVITKVKSAFGFNGQNFALNLGLNNDEVNLANVILVTHGAVHRVLTGEIKDKEISLDGAALVNTKISNCKVNINSGEFLIMENVQMEDVALYLGGPAKSVADLMDAIKPQKEPNPIKEK